MERVYSYNLGTRTGPYFHSKIPCHSFTRLQHQGLFPGLSGLQSLSFKFKDFSGSLQTL